MNVVGPAATPIAVIGMACRLPGGISSPEDFWQSLLRGDDLVTEVPADRWDFHAFYDPEPGVSGRTTSKWGAFLDDVAGFDADFFAINDREAAALDPQHRLLMETSWEAMEHAGLAPGALAGTSAGVFMGLTHLDYQLVNAESDAMQGPYGFEGNTLSMASGRIAYSMGLTGPALTLDTACSSGLMAVHMGCRNLQDGDCDVAFAGGAYVMLEPRKFVAGSAQNHLSPTGRCHAFDIAADGYVCGEAAAVVVLKRLADARRDDDRILAVIRGSGANQDGHTVNISTPSRTAQAELYRRTLTAAGVEARSVGMVEAHGPGTPVGDPIEYASLSEVYGAESPCALGSVKTNLGHAQSASGIVGLIKAILAVQHGVIPKNLHFERLPDEMAKIETQLFVPREVTPWPSAGTHPRRAAVSSYGVSGTNVHAVIESAPEADDNRAVRHWGTGPVIVPLSSSGADELRRTAVRLADWVDTHHEFDIYDVGYTLARRRAFRPVRAAVIAADRSQLSSALRIFADEDSPRPPAVGRDDRGPVWVFSGQGSQWAGMGRELLDTEPVFAATIARLEPLIAAESGFSVREAMASRDVVTGIDRVQPTLFAMQVAIAAALRAHGVTPGAVIGHSMGETAAAVVSGALSLEDGVRVICRRSRLMAGIAGSGAMGSVELPAKQVLSELTLRGIKDVVVAVVASPTSTVIGGAAPTVRELIAAWDEQGVMAREVAVDVASHSPQVDPILAQLETELGDLSPLPPATPFYSATAFDPRDEPVCNGKYWVHNLRRTVRFASAVRAALDDGYRVFTEISPHPLLTRAIEQTAESVDVPLATVAALRREAAVPHGLLPVVADLYTVGAAVDFSVTYPDGRLVDAPLPYWAHRDLMLERRSANARAGHTVEAHPLLGPHVKSPDEPDRYIWQGEVGTADQPWLADHVVHGVAVLPGAAYCELALAAAHAVLGGEAAEVCDIRFEDALLLDGQSAVSASTSASASGGVGFTVESFTGDQRTRHATATVRGANDEPPPPHPVAQMTDGHLDAEAGERSRALLAGAGIEYGPAFRGLAGVWAVDDDTVLAQVTLPSQIRSQAGLFGIHPALLDACFQAVTAVPSARRLAPGTLMLPLGSRRLRAYGSTRAAQYCVVRVVSADASGVEADLDVIDRDGAVLLRVEGVRFGDGDAATDRRERTLAQRLLGIDWHRAELPEPASSYAGAWLLIDAAAGSDLIASALPDALKAAGAQCTTVAWPAHADHAANSDQVERALRGGEWAGVVIATGSQNADEGPPSLTGRHCVEHLVHITRAVARVPGQVPPVFLLTRRARSVLPADVPNLEHGGLRGLVRVVAAEYPHVRVIQTDVDEATGADQVVRQLLSGSEEDETAWRDDDWYVARLRPAPLRPEERRCALVDFDRDAVRMRVRTPGDLQTLELVAEERRSPQAGQIEVAVTSSSINFADALLAMGLFPALDGNLPELGMDFAGVVTAVGPGVEGHRVGDPVVGFSRHGCWGTFVTCDAHLAVPRPATLTDHQAVAAATVAATAWYGLTDQARIRPGEKVLIHSATGGVGQAAIAVARAAGAEIFATAGSEDRRRRLRDMGIDHVYDSRSTAFAEQIRRDTSGYGVDVVLNSLTGAAQRAGLELLATGGRFVEIGKRDVYGNTRLGLFPFRHNLSFHYVDLALMSVTDPARTGELLATVIDLVADGTITAPESTAYPLTEAATAIREMSAAQHTGKLILDIPRSGSNTGAHTVPVPPDQAPVFRCDGAYLVSGGLGGLGLFLAERMAGAGCGRIVLTSRSEPTPEAAETLARLRAGGADIVVECGDIADAHTARRMVDAATATGLPVRGVLHAAAVVEDATLPNITEELIGRDWSAKVGGAWVLHEATAGQPLDWFCSFSSAAALVGSPGQGAYAAANSWLDAFARWQRASGCPATAVAWGAWSQIGRATDFAADTGASIDPDEGAYAFETLLRYDRAYTGYAPLIGTTWLTAFAQQSRFAEEFRSVGQSESPGSTLLAELTDLPEPEWPARLRRLISDQISLILRRTVDPDRPLSEYGVDSLGALELRTRLEGETGVRLSGADIAVGTVRRLAEVLVEKLTAATGSDRSRTP